MCTFPACCKSPGKPGQMPGWWLQQRHATPQLRWERSTGTAAGHEASAGKWRGQTTSARESSPKDIGATSRAQPQALPSLPACPWPMLTCPISPSTKEEHDIICFLPSLPVFSVCPGGPSSPPGTHSARCSVALMGPLLKWKD